MYSFVYLKLCSSTTRSKEIISPISLARHVSSLSQVNTHLPKCLKFNLQMLYSVLPKHFADMLDTFTQKYLLYIHQVNVKALYLTSSNSRQNIVQK